MIIEREDLHFDSFLSQHMARVPLAVFIMEDNYNYDINIGTAQKLMQLYKIIFKKKLNIHFT